MRRIVDAFELKACRHPQHDPPTMISLPPGIYEHSCPRCHAVQHVTITKPSL